MANKKPDIGHRETDKLISEMEKKIAKEYKQAEKEVSAKLDDYLRRFDIKDQTWRRWVADGKKTAEEYKAWRTGQIAIGKRWTDLRNQLAEDYHNTNQIAKSIANGYKPEVYALNHNYATFEVEKGSLIDTSYTLYSRETAERIFRDNPQMLPPPGKKTSARIAAGLDKRWNNQQIQSVMMQGLLQGKSIPDIATHLAETVGDSNRKAAVRNARTMVTGAQNAGRIDAYKRANSLGIKTQKKWLATLDSRTRHSHRALDGDTADVDEPFSNGLMFPGDPDGEAAEVYNCRCTLLSVIEGFEIDTSDTDLRHDDHLGDMSYEEWKEDRKSTSNPILLPEEKARSIKASYIKKYREG